MSSRKLLLATTVLSLLPFIATPVVAAEGDASEIVALKRQNSKLQKDLMSMMARLEALETQSSVSTHKADAALVTADAAKAEADKAVTVDDAGGFKIPGTGTTIKIGGYVKADAIHDFSARPTSSGGSTAADMTDFTTIPTKQDTVLGNRKHASRIDARETRVNLTTKTPTSYGDVKTVVEMDFYGSGGNALLTNSYTPRLRKAYGTIGGWRIGQDWSTFMDVDVIPDTLDFGGPAGGTTIRQAQFRYTKDFANGHALSVAIENPESDFTDDAGGTETNAINHYPDFVAAWRYDGGWGHVGLRGVARNIAFDGGKTATTPVDKESEWGYGLSASGMWTPFAEHSGKAYAKDNLFFLFQGGDGIGRYLLESVELGAAVNKTAGSLHLQYAWGGYAGLQHYWLDNLRSSAVYGHTAIDLKDILPAATTEKADSFHVNLVWSPIKSMDVGGEYIWGRREVKGGASGEMNRAQVSVKYMF